MITNGRFAKNGGNAGNGKRPASELRGIAKTLEIGKTRGWGGEEI